MKAMNWFNYSTIASHFIFTYVHIQNTRTVAQALLKQRNLPKQREKHSPKKKSTKITNELKQKQHLVERIINQ